MTSPIGLLLVHGIGNQKPGSICSTVAPRIADKTAASKENGLSVWDKIRILWKRLRNICKKPDFPLEQLISIDGAPVIVREANWSEGSDPSNPPRTRLGFGVISESCRTIVSAWSSGLVFRGLLPRDSRAGAYISMGIVMVLIIMFGTMVSTAAYSSGAWEHFTESKEFWKAVSILIGLSEPPPLPTSDLVPEPQPSPTSDLVIEVMLPTIAAMVILLTILLYRSNLLKYMQRSWLIPVRLIAIFFLAIVALQPLMIVALSLLAFFVYVVTGIILTSVSWLISSGMRLISYFFQHVHLSWIAKWLNRLTCIVIVLPAQVFQEVNKAFVNIISIVLLDEKGTRKVSAFGVGLIVYIGSYALILFCVILASIPVTPFTALFLEYDQKLTILLFLQLLAFSLLFFVLECVIFIKPLLPVADLVLDIGKYHLAEPIQRAEDYQTVVEEGIKELEGKGCNQIHILAHSLGSVIIYDWLKSLKSLPKAVCVLHTIGSPLNKFWYLDHNEDQRCDDLKGKRPSNLRLWRNYWAVSDLISGALRKYSPAAENRRLRWLGPLLLSHVRYWKNKEVLDAVRAQLIYERKMVT